MIPKIIHYCWFGRNPKPPIIEKCISSWKKYCLRFNICQYKKFELCNTLLVPYLEKSYTKETELVNTKMNYPIFKREFPTLKWDGKTQILDNVIIIGCEEYGEVMKHWGTRTWCDNLPEYHVTGPSKLKALLRNPRIFEKLENSKILKKFLPMYTFLSYDLLDLGPSYFIKLQLLKLRKK